MTDNDRPLPHISRIRDAEAEAEEWKSLAEEQGDRIRDLKKRLDFGLLILAGSAFLVGGVAVYLLRLDRPEAALFVGIVAAVLMWASFELDWTKE